MRTSGGRSEIPGVCTGSRVENSLTSRLERERNTGSFDCASASLRETLASLRMTGGRACTGIGSFHDLAFLGVAALASRRAISAKRVAASSCREDLIDW